MPSAYDEVAAVVADLELRHLRGGRENGARQDECRREDRALGSHGPIFRRLTT